MNENEDKNSLLYWFPKIKDLGIKTPKTEIVPFEVSNEDLVNYFEGETTNLDFNVLMPKYYNAADKFGYPVFLRTDQTSNKHDWQETCFVTKKEDLKKHLKTLLYFTLCAGFFGLPTNAIVFREYIPMKELFRAFNNMPVNPEYRFFIKDGEVLCHHWYWIEEAIKNHCDEESWMGKISKAKKTYEKDIPELTAYAKKVAENIEGFWSVDFCLSANDEWYLIDMATGYASWHPESCEFVAG